MILCYDIKPLPTLAPSAPSGSLGMYQLVDDVFNRFVTMLSSVPVIPNAQGLFDSNGNWLTPAVSVFDVLVALLVIFCTIGIWSRLGGGSGFISRLGGSVKGERY